jgi:hypothetical protein
MFKKVLLGMVIVLCLPTVARAQTAKWYPFQYDFVGPTLSETGNNPNPFLDYRFFLLLTSPSGRSLKIPGYFAGNGQGGGTGNVWRAKFSPDEVGTWTYVASFKTGSNINTSLDPYAGTASHFNGQTGSFTVTPLNPGAPGFYKWGLLEYTGGHYLRFRDGPYFLKGGTDSPENFLGYLGFDNTHDQGGVGIVHTYGPHRTDFQSGDPLWTSDMGGDSRGIIGALNYLASVNVNSIYFLPMNLGGDGQETYPFVSPANTHDAKVHYDISKLDQWDRMFLHAQAGGIQLHVVLNETEEANTKWLDNGTLGVERKLFYRELIARFGYHLALKWNLSEETRFDPAYLKQFADYITNLDPSRHPIGVHTPRDEMYFYNALFGHPSFSISSTQSTPDQASHWAYYIRQQSGSAGRPWVIDQDEQTDLMDPEHDEAIRIRLIGDTYFSGANLELYLGHARDTNLENFRERERLFNYMWYIRKFVQTELPFWNMGPNNSLISRDVSGATPQVLVQSSGNYLAIYYPITQPTGTLNLATYPNFAGIYDQRWYNPRTGQFQGSTTQKQISSGGSIPIGDPPADGSSDWIVLLKKVGAPPPSPPPPSAPPPTVPPPTNPPPSTQPTNPPPTNTQAPPRPGDINGDGNVNGLDYSIFYGEWGKAVPPGDSRCDFNRDKMINGLDYLILYQNWDPL